MPNGSGSPAEREGDPGKAGEDQRIAQNGPQEIARPRLALGAERNHRKDVDRRHGDGEDDRRARQTFGAVEAADRRKAEIGVEADDALDERPVAGGVPAAEPAQQGDEREGDAQDDEDRRRRA